MRFSFIIRFVLLFVLLLVIKYLIILSIYFLVSLPIGYGDYIFLYFFPHLCLICFYGSYSFNVLHSEKTMVCKFNDLQTSFVFLSFLFNSIYGNWNWSLYAIILEQHLHCTRCVVNKQIFFSIDCKEKSIIYKHANFDLFANSKM